jgi:hypothetical protein
MTVLFEKNIILGKKHVEMMAKFSFVFKKIALSV